MVKVLTLKVFCLLISLTSLSFSQTNRRNENKILDSKNFHQFNLIFKHERRLANKEINDLINEIKNLQNQNNSQRVQELRMKLLDNPKELEDKQLVKQMLEFYFNAQYDEQLMSNIIEYGFLVKQIILANKCDKNCIKQVEEKTEQLIQLKENDPRQNNYNFINFFIILQYLELMPKELSTKFEEEIFKPYLTSLGANINMIDLQKKLINLIDLILYLFHYPLQIKQLLEFICNQIVNNNIINQELIISLIKQLCWFNTKEIQRYHNQYDQLFIISMQFCFQTFNSQDPREQIIYKLVDKMGNFITKKETIEKYLQELLNSFLAFQLNDQTPKTTSIFIFLMEYLFINFNKLNQYQQAKINEKYQQIFTELNANQDNLKYCMQYQQIFRLIFKYRYLFVDKMVNEYVQLFFSVFSSGDQLFHYQDLSKPISLELINQENFDQYKLDFKDLNYFASILIQLKELFSNCYKFTFNQWDQLLFKLDQWSLISDQFQPHLESQITYLIMMIKLNIQECKPKFFQDNFNSKRFNGIIDTYSKNPNFIKIEEIYNEIINNKEFLEVNQIAQKNNKYIISINWLNLQINVLTTMSEKLTREPDFNINQNQMNSHQLKLWQLITNLNSYDSMILVHFDLINLFMFFQIQGIEEGCFLNNQNINKLQNFKIGLLLNFFEWLIE